MVIAIDFGTSNCRVAVIDAHGPRLIEGWEGGRSTPSVLTLLKGGDVEMGKAGKMRAHSSPSGAIVDIKRLMGAWFDEVEVGDWLNSISYDVYRGEEGELLIEFDDLLNKPEVLFGTILSHVKLITEYHIGHDISQAVITVPFYFKESQREALRKAALFAELELLHMVSDTSAAAIAYGLDVDETKTIAIYDFGGGCFSISIVEIGSGVFEVKSINGESQLGGVDFDARLVQWLVKRFRLKEGVNLASERLALLRLREAAEQARIELSHSLQVEIFVPYIATSEDGSHLNLTETLTRSDLESLVYDLILRTLEPCKRALEDAGMTFRDIHEVVMVGGVTRMPRVCEVVEQFFGKQLSSSIDPHEAVVLGAAIYAGILTGDVKDVLLLDVLPHTLRIEGAAGGIFKMISRNTTIPIRITQICTTAEANQDAITVMVYEGEGDDISTNHLVGQWDFCGIAKSGAESAQIEVTLDVNARGEIKVFASEV